MLAGEADAQTRTPAPADFDKIAPRNAGFAAAERHMREVRLDTDVLVAGGGLAGVCAAIAAARHGARVVLVQDRSRLGGNSSSEVKMHVVGANQHTARPGWRESGLIEELRLADAVNNPQRCWELWDLLLYDKVVSEPNITLLLETTLYSATVKDGRITEAAARCDKSEHLYRIRAKIFCDCTGDSRLGLEAGAEMRTGREARAEFGESLAPEKPDNRTLGSSILFTSRLYRNPDAVHAAEVGAQDHQGATAAPQDHESGNTATGGSSGAATTTSSPTTSASASNCSSIVMGVWDYIKNSGDFPDSSYWAMDWVGMMPGKRGSRRLVGDHMLTQHDLMQGSFADAVAIGGWPMDDHPPEGFDRPDLPPNTVLRAAGGLRHPAALALQPQHREPDDGRPQHQRQLRGVHLGARDGHLRGDRPGRRDRRRAVRGVSAYRRATWRAIRRQIAQLQQTLLRDDQTIKGLTNQDPLDLARQATVTASAEAGAATAALLLDGHVRDIPDKKGDPAEVHHWAAPVSAGRPPGSSFAGTARSASAKSRSPSTAASNASSRLPRRNRRTSTCCAPPQPETVKDYTVVARTADGAERVLATVKSNFQRLNRHRFEPAGNPIGARRSASHQRRLAGADLRNPLLRSKPRLAARPLASQG